MVRVPGTFELPVACAALADRYDALVALGVVIRGGTPHFDYVCQAATVGITEVAVRTGDARSASACSPATTRPRRSTGPACPARAEDKGHEAATAAVATVVALRA